MKIWDSVYKYPRSGGKGENTTFACKVGKKSIIDAGPQQLLKKLESTALGRSNQY